MCRMADGKSTRLLYFGEIHQKIKVFNLVIRTSFVDVKHVACVKLKVGKRGIALFYDGSKFEIPFKDFTVKPQSAQSAKVVNKSEIHLRFEVASIEESKFQKPLSQNELPSNLDKEQVVNVQCKNCRSQITDHDRKFSRMLELPSENWQEYLDNWCCHGNEAITKLKDGFNPRQYDCLFGEWYILVHPLAVDAQNIDIVKKCDIFQLLCRRCQGIIGKLNRKANESKQCNVQSLDIKNCDSVQLFKHSVSFQCTVDSTSTDIFENFGEEMYLASTLLNLSRTRMCHKFIVNKTAKKKGVDTSVLLLWILNCDTKFFSSLHYTENCMECDEATRIFSAVKVLYKTYCDDEFRRLKDDWYRNAQTDIVAFPEEICLRLLLFLNQNNKTQPPSLRTTNGFNVSFLTL